MHISSDLSIGDIVQTVVGCVALIISLFAFWKSNKQYKENSISSNEFNTKNLQELARLSEIIKNQQELSKKQIIEIKKLSKPILSLSKCTYDVRKFEKLNSGFIHSGVFRYQLENIGERKADNIRFELYFFDENYAIMHKEKGGIIEVLYPNNKTDFGFNVAEIKFKEKYFFLCLTFTDDEIEGKIDQPYYFRIDSNFEFKKCDSDEMVMIDSAIDAKIYRPMF